MIVSKIALVQMVVLAVILVGAALQPARADETATPQASDSGSCARSQFRVLIDVGHTATSPGADSARGVPEYEFNLKLADVITQSLHEAGFDKTVQLVTRGTRMASLFERAASANNLHGDLFISIHHDSVPDNLKETWQYEERNIPTATGLAATPSSFLITRGSRRQPWYSALTGQELQKRGLHYARHYTLPLMGRYRHDLIDEEAGVYRYDHLIVLTLRACRRCCWKRIDHKPARGLISARPERRVLVAGAVTAAVEEFCASRIQSIAGQPPASNPARYCSTRHARGIKPASPRVISAFTPQKHGRLPPLSDEGVRQRWVAAEGRSAPDATPNAAR
jgi:N-acetylmuramoyl-L-alanine amidase